MQSYFAHLDAGSVAHRSAEPLAYVNATACVYTDNAESSAPLNTQSFPCHRAELF